MSFELSNSVNHQPPQCQQASSSWASHWWCCWTPPPQAPLPASAPTPSKALFNHSLESQIVSADQTVSALYRVGLDVRMNFHQREILDLENVPQPWPVTCQVGRRRRRSSSSRCAMGPSAKWRMWSTSRSPTLRTAWPVTVSRRTEEYLSVLNIVPWPHLTFLRCIQGLYNIYLVWFFSTIVSFFLYI